MKRVRNRKEGKLLTQPGDLRHADGGSDGGIRGRGGCRWIEYLAVKGVGAFALATGDPRRSTEGRKMTRSRIFAAHASYMI